ncbi:NAD(P)-binding protein [Aureobasidium pullulans]|uniref:NAD(P)-binding protein n=1 Tax=Aureobasidium pullulans TaxID=5580 RepID=A0A4S9B205_AURPU|nr:NAD(P)-binding protein [Aureobasidium pullulans]
MAILLTGGTGKTSLHLASLLQQANIPFLLTSRRGPSASSLPTVKFDWNDETTWINAFTHQFPESERITAVYLLSGELAEPAPLLNKFIDLAHNEYGVKRFVLCSGSTAEIGGPYHGKIWQKLHDEKLEYCVLRPSWFMENFSSPGQGHFETIKYKNTILSACADGKIPFVSAEDIARVAFHALTDATPHNRSYRILGPELLTYDQIAEKLSIHLSKKITHVKLSPEQRIQGFKDVGLPSHMSSFLTNLEIMAAEGKEAWEGNDVQLVTGRKPISFDAFVQNNKQVWD